MNDTKRSNSSSNRDQGVNRNLSLTMVLILKITTCFIFMSMPNGNHAFVMHPSRTPQRFTYTLMDNRLMSPSNMLLYSTTSPSSSSSSSSSSSKSSSSNTNQEQNQKKNKNSLDLSNFQNIHTFNDALQQIAFECSKEARYVNFDVISRAGSAEAIVQTLQSSSNTDDNFQPNIITYNMILKIWSKAAQTLSDKHYNRGEVNDVYHAFDNVELPSTEFMEGLDRICSAKDAIEHASALLQSIEYNFLTGQSEIQPNIRSYNIVMDGWIRSRVKDSSQQIQGIFRKMKRWSSVGVSDEEVIQGLGNGQSHEEENKEVAFVHTNAKDWSHIDPNAMTYSITIESYGSRNNENKLHDIQTLVEELENKYEQNPEVTNFKPDMSVANAMIKAHVRNADYMSGGGGKFQQRLSTNSWKTAKEVNEIYIKWNKKFKDTGDLDFKPDVGALTMVIEAYSRCGDITATEKAEALFENMIKEWKETNDDRLKPYSKTFSALITSWAKTRDPRSPHKAEALLKQMEEMYENDMKTKGTSQVAPLIQAYTAVISAWGRSNDKTKPQHALRLLKKCNDIYKETKDIRIKPTLFSYNAAIDACAKCNGTGDEQAQALKIAFAINKAISAAKLEGNHVTYTTLLKAVNRLLVHGDAKNEVVKAVFTKCKEKGYVDDAVLKTFKLAAEQGLFYEVLEGATDKSGNVQFDLIPKEWSRNVKK